ncbi:fungal-specific transcription factor domain-containing protein [Gloeopeniophorella convolvens]|nr:fungal-specific transcription factor domain-containing protein [Gloeopeniophorella convolvens]
MVHSPSVPPDDSPRQMSAQPPSMKRKKFDEDDLNGSKKARTRVSYSCGECHRRKQKCDRQVPCSHCVARKVPELCKAYTPGKPDQDIHLRLARLEHIIEVALPQFASASSFSSRDGTSRDRGRSISPGADAGAHSQAEEDDFGGGTFQAGKWYGTSASGSIAPASVLQQLQNAVPGTKNGSSSSLLSNPPMHDDTKTFVAAIDSVRQDAEPTAADNLKTLIQDCGVPPHKITELVQELPPQRFADVLIDFYFASVNWTRYPISERDFRKSYASVCANGVSVHPNDVRFLPLLFVVLAIAVRVAPEPIAGDARSRRLTSLRYYWSSRRSMLIAAAIQPDSLDMVLTRLLSARYLTFDRRITECWSQLGAAVRTAQALGLHRDASTMGLEPAQVEYRRRVWAYLYHADRSYALFLGRPNAIQDAYSSTLPPLNVEDEVSVSELRSPPPLTTPTRMTFAILRHKLAGIIGRIVHHFQQVRQHSHYSDVLTIDDDILKFLDNLPPHFALNYDASLDDTHQYLPAHRFLLLTEVFFIRISLHRPYLLRRLGSDRYSRSRRACFESAVKDFEIRRTIASKFPQETLVALNIAYRDFQSAMISGIYLVLYPRGSMADSMHTILDTFMKDHEGLREMDETTRRELKIIEFLKVKSSQAEASINESPGFPEPMEPLASADAQLLLSIQKPASRGSFTSLSINGPISPRQGVEPTSPLGQVLPSPTIQRLQGEMTGNDSSNSGSPSAEDESAAQNLLDQWYNAVSMPSGPGGDGSLDFAGLPWGGFGSADLSGWFGATPSTAGAASVSANPAGLGAASDGSDWSYWENLVKEIRGGPVA